MLQALHTCNLLPSATNVQVIGPDVEFVLSRAQAIQEEQSAPIVTVKHLNNALESLQLGGGNAAGSADGLTKADLEATMKQMLMVSFVFAKQHTIAC